MLLLLVVIVEEGQLGKMVKKKIVWDNQSDTCDVKDMEIFENLDDDKFRYHEENDLIGYQNLDD